MFLMTLLTVIRTVGYVIHRLTADLIFPKLAECGKNWLNELVILRLSIRINQ